MCIKASQQICRSHVHAETRRSTLEGKQTQSRSQTLRDSHKHINKCTHGDRRQKKMARIVLLLIIYRCYICCLCSKITRRRHVGKLATFLRIGIIWRINCAVVGRVWICTHWTVVICSMSRWVGCTCLSPSCTMEIKKLFERERTWNVLTAWVH